MKGAVTVKHVPSVVEIEALRATVPAGPIVVMALVRLKDGAEARAAFQRYEALAGSLSDVGRVEVLHVGKFWADLVAGQRWDFVIVARYASFEDLARVVLHPRYQSEAVVLREQALDGAVTLVSQACDFSDLWTLEPAKPV